MIRALALSLAALVAALPALAAEGGPILSGEHDGFSRLVLRIDPTTEWSLETSAGRTTIFVPGKQLGFGTEAIFEKMPRERIRAVRARADPAGTTVEVELGCECRVSTLFVHGRFLAVDVGERGAAPAVAATDPRHPASEYGPPPEDPAARATREASAVASAEQVLIEQIERAASQGLIRLSPPSNAEEAAVDAALGEMAAPEPPTTPEVSPLPALPSRGRHAAVPEPMLDGLADHEQIDAVTVFDRDGSRATERLREAAVPAECLPDGRIDVGAWSGHSSFFDQASKLGSRLVGEFDRPDPESVAALARLYVRQGLGAEAEGLLAGFPVQIPDRALLTDLARAIEGRPVAPRGPLAVTAPCPGRHGLWLAVAGAAPAFHDETHFATVQAAFAELPPDLRALVTPGLVGRLLEADRPAEARLILDTAERPGLVPSADLALSTARLTAAEGDPAGAVEALAALVEGNAPNATDALAHLVRLAVDNGISVPEGLVTDLRATALQQRRAPREAELRELLAEALAHGGALPAAIDEIRSARRDLPEAAVRLETLAVHILGAADPARVGGAAYAEVMLAAGDLIGPGDAGDRARRAIAEHLLKLGLPDAALATIGPAARDDAAARLVVAEALLRLGRGERARATLAGLGGPEAAEIRARALASGGDFRSAMTTLEAEGLAPQGAGYAWPSGDWPRARDAAADPRRLAMASYMAARDGAAENPADASADAARDPGLAFREPLPSLDRPSLGAARRLLASAPEVGGFVQGLLSAD